jgi:hypothetical protein
METTQETEKNNHEANKPRLYHTPELLVYGSIHEITRNLGPTGALDNGGGGGAGPKTG